MIKIEDRFKVRFFHPQTQQMFYPEQNVRYVNGIYNLYEMFSDVEKGKLIPMQCTGLKDKNGKLIYEEDIVKVSGYGVEGIFKMFWDDTTARFCTSIYESDCFEHSQSVMEIIGNVFENKELLNAK